VALDALRRHLAGTALAGRVFVDAVGGTVWLPLHVDFGSPALACAAIAYSVPDRAFARCRARVTEYRSSGKSGRVECAVGGDYAVLLYEWVREWRPWGEHYERLCAFLGGRSRCVAADYRAGATPLRELLRSAGAPRQLADFDEAVAEMLAAPFVDEGRLAALSGRQYGEEEHKKLLSWIGAWAGEGGSRS
jgi:hypothetical protein